MKNRKILENGERVCSKQNCARHFSPVEPKPAIPVVISPSLAECTTTKYLIRDSSKYLQSLRRYQGVKHVRTILHWRGTHLQPEHRSGDISLHRRGICRGVHWPGATDQARAADSAVLGFLKTKNLPVHTRAGILQRLADLIEENREEFASDIVHESGKPLRQAHLEVTRAVHVIRISADAALRIGGEIILLDSTELGGGYTGYYHKIPAGPVLCITPFNYPLNLACHKIGPAIAAGCSFVLKPATKTPFTALLLGRLILEAGYLPKAVNVVPCPGNNTATLVRDPRFAALSFTGSPRVGWKLEEIFAGRRVGLELGGNAPAVVHHDADIIYAARRIAEGAVVNAGQSCISVQRVYLHDDIYHECLKMILENMQEFVVGDPRNEETDLGPMVSETDAIRAEDNIKQAVLCGARILLGGTRDKALLYPTVLERTSPEMGVCSGEAFAPLIYHRALHRHRRRHTNGERIPLQLTGQHLHRLNLHHGKSRPGV